MTKDFKKALLTIFGVLFLGAGGVSIYLSKLDYRGVTWGVPELLFSIIGVVFLILGIYLVISIFREN